MKTQIAFNFLLNLSDVILNHIRVDFDKLNNPDKTFIDRTERGFLAASGPLHNTDHKPISI